MTPRALIVDDERAECELVADALTQAGFEAVWAQDPRRALEMLSARPFDVVVTDLNMPIMNGVELCKRVKAALPHLPVVVVTAFGSIDTAVSAMRAGAYDFLTKPFDVDEVGMVLRRAVEHHALKWEVQALRRVVASADRQSSLIGTSEPMRRLDALIDRVKDSDSTLLVTGESGTGKELVAREIHRRGPRHELPFLVASCSGVPEPLLEGELFGSEGLSPESGPRREGLFVRAQGGTVFLDEIGDLPALLQIKLLRALSERKVRPAGATHEVPFEARVIAATNRDLEDAIENGRFRSDLYYLINVVQLEVPPLRARGGDVLLLAQTFLSEIAIRNDKPVTGFGTAAAERLMAYDWPGNVRELRNCVERAVTLARAALVDVEDLPEKVRNYRPEHLLVVGDDPSEILPLEEVERRYILKVVDACMGNKSQAAKALGIGRRTLYRKLESFGVPVSEDE